MEITDNKSVEIREVSSLTKNIIQFRNKFVNFPNLGENNNQLAVSVMSELLQFGFLLNKDAIDNMASTSKENIISFHNEAIDYLKFLTGAGKNYRPFWSGFPEQVMEMSEINLWVHQIVYYMSNATYEPTAWTKERPTAFEQPKYTEIGLGNDEKFEKIFTTLISVNQSLTPEDLDVVRFFVNNGIELKFPDKIPFKENMSTLVSMGVELNCKLTVTDVLRVAVGMSGGDVSLPSVPPSMIKMNPWSSAKSDNPYREAFKFKKFNRSERRLILSLLEKTNCDETEAVLKDGRWLRLGEIIHPGEYKSKFPRSFDMFNRIRNQKVVSWNGKLSAAFNESFEKGLEVLSERPGEFMRRMDWLVRAEIPKPAKPFNPSAFSILEKYASLPTLENFTPLEVRQELVLKAFKEIANKVSNKVLYEAYSHFEKRYTPTSNRSIMAKGSRKITMLPELPEIEKNIIKNIQRIIVGSLIEKFSLLEKLGKVWIDDELSKIPTPTNMRSVNTSLRPIVRGQRTPIGNKNSKVIRAFCHWYDENGTIDIDLHGFLIGKDKREDIGWNSNHLTGYGCFSGDIICRQGACAEYVDVNVDKAVNDGLRYLVITVNNFRGGSLESVKDCVAGYQEREFAEANMEFVPATIGNCMRLTSASSTTLMSVVDLETRESIHLDLDIEGIPIASNQASQILEAIKPYLESPKFSVKDLLLLHVKARGGELVSELEAEVKFSFEEFSESYIKTLEYMGI